MWKDIEGYEGLYQVSNLGRVKNSRSGMVLKSSRRKDGYHQVSLCKNNLITRCYIHRLVTQAFIPNPQNKPQVNHIDGDKDNNIVDNLEWVTSKENHDHAYKVLGKVANVKNAHLKTSTAIRVTVKETNEIYKFSSIRQAERVLKASLNRVTKYPNMESKKYKIEVL